jgi:hypothetical protein
MRRAILATARLRPLPRHRGARPEIHLKTVIVLERRASGSLAGVSPRMFARAFLRQFMTHAEKESGFDDAYPD